MYGLTLVFVLCFLRDQDSLLHLLKKREVKGSRLNKITELFLSVCVCWFHELKRIENSSWTNKIVHHSGSLSPSPSKSRDLGSPTDHLPPFFFSSFPPFIPPFFPPTSSETGTFSVLDPPGVNVPLKTPGVPGGPSSSVETVGSRGTMERTYLSKTPVLGPTIDLSSVGFRTGVRTPGGR